VRVVQAQGGRPPVDGAMKEEGVRMLERESGAGADGGSGAVPDDDSAPLIAHARACPRKRAAVRTAQGPLTPCATVTSIDAAAVSASDQCIYAVLTRCADDQAQGASSAARDTAGVRALSGFLFAVLRRHVPLRPPLMLWRLAKQRWTARPDAPRRHRGQEVTKSRICLCWYRISIDDAEDSVALGVD
jgi:hypothetical protein